MEERSDRSSPPNNLLKHTNLHKVTTSEAVVSMSRISMSLCLRKGVPEHCSLRVYRNSVPEAKLLVGVCILQLFMRA